MVMKYDSKTVKRGGEIMPRKGRFTLSILVEESKIASTKTKIIAALTTMRNNADIESATGQLTYEEVPETITV